MKKISRVLGWLAAVLILLLGFAWLAGWFNNRIGPGEESIRGSAKVDRPTAEATAKEVATFLAVPGRLSAENRTRVSSELTEKIVEVAVAAGDRVAIGDTLVRLDETELLARVKRIRGVLPAQQVRVAEVQSQFDRDRQLRKDQAVSQDEVETSRRLLAEAKANLGAIEQQLVESEARLDETVIKATMNGTVVDKLVEVGEVASPGVVLLEIYQPASLRLECSVPESLVDGVRVGQELNAEIGSSQQESVVTVDEIVPQADARSRTVIVRSRVPQATKRIEGRYGRLFVPLARNKKIFVPASAVRSLGQLDFVEVVTKDGVERRFVKRATEGPSNEIEILSGLEAGEQVMLATTPSSSSTLQSDERD